MFISIDLLTKNLVHLAYLSSDIWGLLAQFGLG